MAAAISSLPVPDAHSPHGVVNRGEGRHDDHRQGGTEPFHLLEHRDAVHVRHPDILEQQVRPLSRLGKPPEQRDSRGEGLYGITLTGEEFAEIAEDFFVVTDEQSFPGGHGVPRVYRCKRVS